MPSRSTGQNAYWAPGQYIHCESDYTTPSSHSRPAISRSTSGENGELSQVSLIGVLQTLESSITRQFHKVNDTMDGINTRLDKMEEKHSQLENDIRATNSSSPGNSEDGTKRKRLTPTALQVAIAN